MDEGASGAYAVEAILISFKVLSFAFLGIDLLEEQRATRLLARKFAMAPDVRRVLAAPLDLAILQIHEVPSVFLYHRLHAISIKETLFASRCSYRGHDRRRIYLDRVESVHRDPRSPHRFEVVSSSRLTVPNPLCAAMS